MTPTFQRVALCAVLGFLIPLSATSVIGQRVWVNGPPPSDSGKIEVFVFRGEHPAQAISGARVFVLGAAGRGLATAQTNASGLALLPPIPATDQPRYLLAESDFNCIGGLRWSEGQREYNIGVSPLTLF